jgi:hypothetical protein
MIIEHLAYDPVEDKFDLDIFTAGQTKQDFSKAGDKLKRHIYDYVLTDSDTERNFVKELDTSIRSGGLRQAAARLPDPDAGGRLQPRLGHFVQGRRGQARLLRGRDQGLDVVDGAARDRENQDQVRPQVLRRDEPEVRP